MPHIGTFTKTKSGYTGRIKTLALDAELTLRLNERSGSENAPDYRVFSADEQEVGATWNRTGEIIGAYLSLTLGDPAFAQRVRAALYPSQTDEKLWYLVWIRFSKRDGKD